MKPLYVPWVLLICVLPCAGAELTATRMDTALKVQGGHFSLVIDASKGGEITALSLFDGAQWNDVLSDPALTFPRLTFRSPDHAYALARDTQAEWAALEAAPDKVTCALEAIPRSADGAASPWRVLIHYEVYPEGAVFVDLECRLPEGEFVLSQATLTFEPGEVVRKAPKYRNDTVSRLTGGFPSARLAFGRNPERSFTNEVEVMVEHKRAMTGTAGIKQEDAKTTWILADGETALGAPFAYHNRLALGLGAAVTGKPKSNVVGQRVYHWVNWLDLEDWYPANEQIDAMVANGATMLILHHEWMLQRGSNGFPHADYSVVRNHEDMVRMIDYAHAKGLRLGLYMRGVEMYALKTGFFTTYCKRNWDGIYLDWHGPHAVSWHEQKYDPEAPLGDTHFSDSGSHVPARDYFLFTRKLRDLVGPQGFLIGHQGSFNSGVFANLCFDAFLPGETGSDRQMFADMDEAAYKGMQGGGVCMPWMLDLPLFRNAEGCAKMAAWGFYPHLVMGIKARRTENLVFPLDPNDPLYAYILPYWRLLAHIGVEQATVYNLPSQNVVALRATHPDFHGVVYKSGDSCLVIAANLGKAAATAQLDLDTAVLGMTGAYQVAHIDAATGNVTPRGTTTGALITSELPQWGLEGFKLSK